MRCGLLSDATTTTTTTGAARMWLLGVVCLTSCCLLAGAQADQYNAGLYNGNRHRNDIPRLHGDSNAVVNGNGRTYSCPAQFVRSGNSCYYLSHEMAAWQEAHFICKDRRAHLARLEKGWEDRNMRNYLNKHELAPLERWIGGMFNWESRRWVWAETGRKLGYQAFSRRTSRDNYQWRCIIMDPNMLYRWGTRSCVERKHFICETPLKNPRHPNELVQRRRDKRRRMRKAMKECQRQGRADCKT